MCYVASTGAQILATIASLHLGALKKSQIQWTTSRLDERKWLASKARPYHRVPLHSFPFSNGAKQSHHHYLKKQGLINEEICLLCLFLSTLFQFMGSVVRLKVSWLHSSPFLEITCPLLRCWIIKSQSWGASALPTAYCRRLLSQLMELDELILITWKTEGQCIKLMQQHISKGGMTSPPYYNLVSENGSLLPAANIVNRHSAQNNWEYWNM